MSKLQEEAVTYEHKIEGGKREEQSLLEELAALKETHKEVCARARGQRTRTGGEEVGGARK